MGNRRHAKSKKGRRAPADPQSAGEGPLAKSTRGFWGWVLTSLKVGLGVAVLSGAVVGISCGVYRYARTTPRFSAQAIAIEGTKRLSREDVLSASGLELGKNLFSLDVEAAQRTLLESPWIESARVTRRLPDSLLIEIHERQARATLVLPEKSFLVDADGTPFKVVGLGDPHDLPVITGVSTRALLSDRPIEQERLRDLLRLMRDYEYLKVAKNYPLEEVHLDPSGDVSLVVGASGVTLYLGKPPFKQRLLRAERVFSKTLQRGARPAVVFLDNEAHPERVVVRVQ